MSVIRDYQASLVSKKEVSPGIWSFTIECPAIVKEAGPGNFVLLKVSGGTAPLLRRPLGVLETDTERETFGVLFRVVGVGTEFLSKMIPGQTLSVRGPVGGEFGPFKHDKVWAVAGTLGVVPLLFLRQFRGAFDKMFLGVGNAEWRPFAEWVRARVPEMELFSDDGSIGKKGFAIDGLKGQDLRDVSLAACGPNPMMKALYEQYGTQCDDIQVSLERRMGCGMGGCFGCVVDTTAGRRRVCVDGPVFQAREVKWDELHL